MPLGPLSGCRMLRLMLFKVAYSFLVRSFTTLWYYFDFIVSCSAGVISFLVS